MNLMPLRIRFLNLFLFEAILDDLKQSFSGRSFTINPGAVPAAAVDDKRSGV